MPEYIIIGAGISGIVMAERIANVLNKRVLLVERRDHIGGNCYDEKNEENILIHKYGPHLFHTDKKEVVDYLSKFTRWSIYTHKVLADIDGERVPIPFNFNTMERLFPRHLVYELEKILLEKYPYDSKIPILELRESTEEKLQFLADYIYKKVFMNYSAKQWGMSPEEIDPAVTARVPISLNRDNRYFSDRYQMVPRRGYAYMFKNMLKHPNIKLMLNTDFRDVCEICNEGFRLFGRSFSGKVIYTGQIDELFDYKFGELPYRSVKMVFETIACEKFQETATVNYPNQYEFTRITEFKYVHPIQTKMTTILKEYPQPYHAGKNLPYYPIFTAENQQQYNRYKEYAKLFPQLIILGRLAEYRYYDMDDAVENALNVFDRIRVEAHV